MLILQWKCGPKVPKRCHKSISLNNGRVSTSWAIPDNCFSSLFWKAPHPPGTNYACAPLSACLFVLWDFMVLSLLSCPSSVFFSWASTMDFVFPCSSCALCLWSFSCCPMDSSQAAHILLALTPQHSCSGLSSGFPVCQINILLVVWWL